MAEGVVGSCGWEVVTVAMTVMVGVAGEVEAGEEGPEGRVAVDEGGDMGGACLDEGSEREG